MIFQLVLHAFNPGVELGCSVCTMCGSERFKDVFMIHILIESEGCHVGEEVEVRGGKSVPSEELRVSDGKVSLDGKV